MHNTLKKQTIKDGIQIVGAKENNLKNINVFIPRNQITVITGLSGSGKSTLAFDTIYGEGQRRYLDSLSVYARYFIDKIKRPKVDHIHGLSPSIAINQKTISFNPRSTVGTMTEIYDLLRLLYARIGSVKCPIHKQNLQSQTIQEISADICNLQKTDPLLILSPIARKKKGSFEKELAHCLDLGLDQARIDESWKDIGNSAKLRKNQEHSIDILIDCISKNFTDLEKVQRAVTQAIKLSKSFVKVETKKGFEKKYSLDFACPDCDYNFVELESKLFSFNHPKGACPSCNGTGLAYQQEASLNTENITKQLEPSSICLECKGARLNPQALQVYIKNYNIHHVNSMNISQIKQFIESLKFQDIKQQILIKIKEPLLEKISFLQDIHLDYLSLNRSLSTLSGGEAQRIRLASQLSSSIIGVIYVLDEPSIGLHAKDHNYILNAIKHIRDRGNTICLVEHDAASIRQADKIIDLGPGAGKEGGYITAQGTVSQIIKNKKSLTGAYLSKNKNIPHYKSQYTGKEDFFNLKGLCKNNLKKLDVRLPLSRLIGFSGVSGSGKSSLVTDTIYPFLSNVINKTQKPVGQYTQIQGFENIKKVIQINQKPIGRTPRSNPLTYIGVFSLIRNLFASLPESKMLAYSSKFFSFNVEGGRCEHCKGAGSVKLEMRFLPDVFVTCEVCNGKKYNSEILNIYFKQKNILDVLNMNVNEAKIFFKNHHYIYHHLEFLQDVGLGYIKLGQSSLTLSGGEAQRIKLSKELSKKIKSPCLYILDEPTTGLHFQDVAALVKILRQFVDQGHTVLVIEHHLDVLKSCDYLIDLGPVGGTQGGHIIAQGSPEQVSKNPNSWTGKYLKTYFKKPQYTNV